MENKFLFIPIKLIIIHMIFIKLPIKLRFKNL